MCENPDRKDYEFVTPDGGKGILLHRHPDFRHDDEKHVFPVGQVVILKTWADDDDQFCCGNIVRSSEDKEVVLGIQGRVKLIVVGHSRDCDGEPLYMLSDHPIGYDSTPNSKNGILQAITYKRWVGLFINNVSKRSLTACEGEFVPMKHDNIFEYEDGMRKALDEFQSRR